METSPKWSLRVRWGTPPLDIKYRKNYQLQSPIEESSIGKQCELWGPTGKDAPHISYKKQTIPVIQPTRSHHHPELLLSSNGLSFKRTPPNFLLLLKQCSSPLLDSPMVLPQFACPKVQFCYSSINPICWLKITGCFNFQVNISLLVYAAWLLMRLSSSTLLIPLKLLLPRFYFILFLSWRIPNIFCYYRSVVSKK